VGRTGLDSEDPGSPHDPVDRFVPNVPDPSRPLLTREHDGSRGELPRSETRWSPRPLGLSGRVFLLDMTSFPAIGIGWKEGLSPNTPSLGPGAVDKEPARRTGTRPVRDTDSRLSLFESFPCGSAPCADPSSGAPSACAERPVPPGPVMDPRFQPGSMIPALQTGKTSGFLSAATAPARKKLRELDRISRRNRTDRSCLSVPGTIGSQSGSGLGNDGDSFL
jgi:hypothetical protein